MTVQSPTAHSNDPDQMIRVVIGFDQREAVAYHTFCQSIIATASQAVSIVPLAPQLLREYAETHTDGSNAFTYPRFLTPFLFKYQGWAIFADGDMICLKDIAELWRLRDDTKAVMCVKHDYKTKARTKYLGNKNEDYPRKNWSSLVLWNCGHPRNALLTPDFVMGQTGAFLHRFSWLDDELIGDLPLEWNWLTTEYPDNDNAKLLHFTLGTPCFKDYWSAEMSSVWHAYHAASLEGIGS
jgi:lipopolysaccharide biosynthesis glycosyltransferase